MEIRKEKRKLGIFVDHDIVIRHFILSGIFGDLSRDYELHYIFPRNYPSRVKSPIESLQLENVHLINVNAGRVSKLRTLCRLKDFKNIGMREGRDRLAMETFYRHLFRGRGQYLLAQVKTFGFLYRFYERYIRFQIGECREIKEFIEDLKLDIIIHPTVLEGIFINDLIEIGKKKGIPTICLMNSWDNPSCKATVMGYPDRLLVWGEQTKKHAVKYLGMKETSIVISGAAQFQIYRSPPAISRDEYRRKIGLDSEDIVICYAGSSKGLNEMHHLELLESKIKEYGKYNIKVVYKPHPWKSAHESEREFFDYKFSEIFIDPFSVDNYIAVRRGDDFRIDLMDYGNTKTILHSVDAVISPMSTILLEAALHGLPIAVYLSDDGIKNNLHFKVASSRTQFTEFFKQIDLLLCNDLQEIWPTTLELVNRTSDVPMHDKLKHQSRYFVESMGKTYGRTLVETVEEFSDE